MNSPLITLDEKTHAYRMGGVRRPGVTEVFTGLSLIDSQYFTEESRRRGHAVHAAIHYHLEGDLDWKTVKPRFVGYVEGAIRLIDTLKLEALRVEVLTGSRLHGFCGRPDFVGTIAGEPIILDWKSGLVGETTGMQTAAYEIALREGDPVFDGAARVRRFGVALNPDGTFPKPTEFKSYKDERRFLAALDLYKTFVFPRRLKEVA